MRVPVVAGIDVSTTGARVVLVDEGGLVHAFGRSSFTPGRIAAAERQDASSWMTAVIEAFRCALDCAPRGVVVEAIGIASQGITVVPLSPSGEPDDLAVSWLSTSDRNRDQRRDAEDWFRRSGRRLTPAYLPMLARRRRERGQPQPWRWSLVGETIASELSGEHFVGPCLASTTGLLDPVSRTWSPSLLHEAGVSQSSLPAIREASDATRRVRGSRRNEELGLSDGTIIASPTQDQRAAVAMADPTGSRLAVTTGTAAAIIARIDVPLIDQHARIPLTPSWGPDQWELEGVVGSAGASLSWAAGVLGFADVSALLDASMRVPVGANGVRFAPHLAGSTSPDWDDTQRGSFTGISISTDRRDLARAVVEGLCREIAVNCALVVDLCGARDEVVLLGGLSRHAAIGGTLSSMLARPVIEVQVEHPTVLGAAARAASVRGWDIRAALAHRVIAGALTRRPDLADAVEYAAMGVSGA